MIKTAWKSKEEIALLLEGHRNIAMIACGMCAKLSNIGGKEGICYLTSLLSEMGKNTVFARTIIACCPEELMYRAFNAYQKRINKADAVVILSCPGGIQSAFLTSTDITIPILSLTDPIGVGPAVNTDSPRKQIPYSLCRSCGHCVMTSTGGICPIAHCPAKRRYGPCKNAPHEGTLCAMDESRNCIWRIIEQQNNVDGRQLVSLKEYHKQDNYERAINDLPRNRYPLLRGMMAGLAVRIQSLEGMITLFK